MDRLTNCALSDITAMTPDAAVGVTSDAIRATSAVVVSGLELVSISVLGSISGSGDGVSGGSMTSSGDLGGSRGGDGNRSGSVSCL